MAIPLGLGAGGRGASGVDVRDLGRVGRVVSRAKARRVWGRALSGLWCYVMVCLGRCPSLSHFAPLGLGDGWKAGGAGTELSRFRGWGGIRVLCTERVVIPARRVELGEGLARLNGVGPGDDSQCGRADRTLRELEIGSSAI